MTWTVRASAGTSRILRNSEKLNQNMISTRMVGMTVQVISSQVCCVTFSGLG